MRHIAIALACIGIVASVAYCTTQVHRLDVERHTARMELCAKQGGRWTDGWGPSYCEFEEGR